MATAPTPGAVRKDKARRLGIRITVRGESHDIIQADLGPGDNLRVRRATGLSLREMTDGEHFDIDSAAVLWWFARSRRDEPTLTLDQAFSEFPTYTELEADAQLVDITAIEVTEDDSPEA